MTRRLKFWYLRGAEAGDPSAMRVVAFTTKDDTEKFKWYKLSAELLEDGLNKQDSIKETAIHYACGRGTDTDEAATDEWLAKLGERDKNTWSERAGEFDPMAMIRIAEDFTL